MKALLKSWFIAAGQRGVGALAGFAAAVATTKLGITVDPKSQAAVVVAGYGIVHTLANHLFGTNPQ